MSAPDKFPHVGAVAAGAGNGVAPAAAQKQAAPIKRSRAYVVQRLCALAVTGPGFRGAVQTRDFAMAKLVLKYFEYVSAHL
jgi:hypothetical protein